jgi:RHS repeat-associated protein
VPTEGARPPGVSGFVFARTIRERVRTKVGRCRRRAPLAQEGLADLGGPGGNTDGRTRDGREAQRTVAGADVPDRTAIPGKDRSLWSAHFGGGHAGTGRESALGWNRRSAVEAEEVSKVVRSQGYRALRSQQDITPDGPVNQGDSPRPSVAVDRPTGDFVVYPVNRAYDPTTGQFLSVDPLVAEIGQPYGYADENPVNADDPTGLQCNGSDSWLNDVPLGGSECNVARGTTHAAHDAADNAGASLEIASEGVGYLAAEGIGSATNWADAHVSISAVICNQSCYGLEFQNGHLYSISGSGPIAGASWSINLNSNGSSPADTCFTTWNVGLGGASAGDGNYSLGAGLGGLFGVAHLHAGREIG